MSDLEIGQENEEQQVEHIKAKENEEGQVEHIKAKPNKVIYYIAALGFISIISILVSINAIQTSRNIDHKLADINNRIDSLEVDKALMESMAKSKEAAFMDISSPDSGFSYASCDSGVFLITLKDISPHLNGSYKATITIGNMSNATFHGFKIKYNWGFLKEDEEIKELSFTDKLNPGSWHNVTAYLSTPSQKDENILMIYIETNEVSLRR